MCQNQYGQAVELQRLPPHVIITRPDVLTTTQTPRVVAPIPECRYSKQYPWVGEYKAKSINYNDLVVGKTTNFETVAATPDEPEYIQMSLMG